MSLLFMDGFDLYNGVQANIGLFTRWASLGNVGLNLTTGRFGGQALRLYASRFADVGAAAPTPVITTTPGSSFSVCKAIRVNNLISLTANNASGFCILTSGGAANTQLGWRPNSDGSISVYRLSAQRTGVLLYTTAAGILASNVWHYVEFSGLIDAAAGTVVMKVDGVQVVNLSAQNTKGYATNATFDNVLFTTNGIQAVDNMPMDVDDLYILDTAVSLGERKIETIRPNADTATKQWLPDTGTVNFSRVNESTVNTANYVQSNVVGNADLYDCVDLVGTPPNVDAVQIVTFAQKSDAGSRSIAIVADLGGTQTVSSDKALAASYAPIVITLPTKPGGGGWSYGDVNNLKVGPKVTV